MSAIVVADLSVKFVSGAFAKLATCFGAVSIISKGSRTNFEANTTSDFASALEGRRAVATFLEADFLPREIITGWPQARPRRREQQDPRRERRLLLAHAPRERALREFA